MNALQGFPADQLVPLLANLEEVRMSLFTSDSLRSFFIILIGVNLILAYGMGKLKQNVLIGALTVLCLVDMWAVNKRYLYDDQFVEKQVQTQGFQQTETDKMILADESLDYRVLNLASNTFNENNTAYWHKSVGGYHAAKLRRYQEMIEEHISGEMSALFKAVADAEGDMEQIDASQFPVLNMLNTKYFIFPLQGGQTLPLPNPHTLGNAWFVKKVQYVNNANEEIEAIHGLDPSETAVVDKRFEPVVKPITSDSTATIRLVVYEPNHLKYEVNSNTGGTIVFSEIYYPGWRSSIDGQEVPHGRANYILRAMNVPAGKHEVEFSFDPVSLHVTENIAYIALGLLALMAIVMAVLKIKAYKKA
ncbi:MAG: YfhO family protein, partial [Bacteroidaceae bacterium]|nr:YfhO family protein [Bacteroidaceae bacterium]